MVSLVTTAELVVLLLVLSVVLVVVGVLLVFIGALVSAMKSSRERGEKRIEGGGVLIIGPVPIVLASSERIAKVLLILAIALTLVVLITYLVLAGFVRVL